MTMQSMRSMAFLGAAASVALLFSATWQVAYSIVPPRDGEAVISRLAPESLLLSVARAGKRLVAVGEYGDVVLSDDNGVTWRQATKVPSTVTLTSVFFIDDKTGWAVGHDTLVLVTKDGGETWTKQNGGGASENALLSVYFKDATHGWAVGAFNYTIQTDDGGKTWKDRKTLIPISSTTNDGSAEKSKADPYAAAEGDENHLNSMFAGPDANTIFVAAEAGAVYRSTDGGLNWSKILTGYAGSFWGGLTAKDGTVYVTGMRGNIWKSVDRGETWSKLDTSGADQSIAGGIQLSDGSLVFVGLGGQVLYSNDGATFTLTYRPDRVGLNAVAQDGKTLLVFGEAGVKPQSPTAVASEIDVPLPSTSN